MDSDRHGMCPHGESYRRVCPTDMRRRYVVVGIDETKLTREERTLRTTQRGSDLRRRWV